MSVRRTAGAALIQGLRLIGCQLVSLETALNEAVYEAFGLDEEERKLIEQETKYRYGEW